jgi:hypothetical protein
VQQDQPEKRNAISRIVGFVSIILVLALVCGFIALFYDYVRRHSADTWSERERSREHVERDTTSAMKQRFAIGAAAGASVGILYVIRCVRRREDP